jgi:hypothetical protein
LAHVTYCSLIEGDLFSFSCIDEVCVAAALGKITSNATSLDGIQLVFKLLLPLILAVITEIFNDILTFSIFPLVWEIYSVVPILKVHSHTEKSDYRLISILPESTSAAMVLFCHFSLVIDLVIARQML